MSKSFLAHKVLSMPECVCIYSMLCYWLKNQLLGLLLLLLMPLLPLLMAFV